MVFILSSTQNPEELSRYLESVDRSEFIREANRPQILSPAWSSLSSPQHSIRGKFLFILPIWNVPRGTFHLCCGPCGSVFCLLFFEDIVIKKSQNSRNQGFSYCVCCMIEGSRPESVHLTNWYESTSIAEHVGSPNKSQIRISNTVHTSCFFYPPRI